MPENVNQTLDRRREETQRLAAERTERIMEESMSRMSELAAAGFDAMSKNVGLLGAFYSYWGESLRGTQAAFGRLVDTTSRAFDQMEHEAPQPGQQRKAG